MAGNVCAKQTVLYNKNCLDVDMGFLASFPTLTSEGKFYVKVIAIFVWNKNGFLIMNYIFYECLNIDFRSFFL